ncbi:hypothetical protein DPMN_073270 [Dreissena polymorpha]|uniref:Uncharacterized protein n=1 Tax=Dreissena polymorpha TaxID=45954 RepID=A0A9D4BYQ7_DREPO|nr:hypothetical protein DPMN_073270 [Dreissena polymorpha]
MWPLEKNAPPLGSYVFQAKVTNFVLIQNIIGTNLLSKFHEDLKINVASRVLTRKFRENCPAPWRPYINKTNVLTKFHDDWAKIVTSRVFTRNTATPPGGHLHEDWASNLTSTVFELSRDPTIHVASRVFRRQNTKGDHKSSP